MAVAVAKRFKATREARWAEKEAAGATNPRGVAGTSFMVAVAIGFQYHSCCCRTFTTDNCSSMGSSSWLVVIVHSIRPQVTGHQLD